MFRTTSYLLWGCLIIVLYVSAAQSGHNSEQPPVSAVAPGCRIDVLQSSVSGLEIKAELLQIEFEPVSIDGEEACSVYISGEEPIKHEGYPALPCISRLVAVPPEAGIRIGWHGSEPRAISSSKFESSQVLKFSSSQIGKDDGYWPPEVVQIGEPVIIRGIRLVNLKINPVQILKATGELRIWDDITVSLHYDGGEVVNPVRQPGRLRPSSAALKLARSIVINPQDIRRDEGLEFGTCVYVIPTFDGVREAIEPLVRWRQRQGFPVAVIQAAVNASNVDVKRALQDAYDNWEIPPEYITLVGEADLVNADFRIPYWDVGWNYWWETDYQYVLLEGQDMLPEAAIGRISCRNLGDLRTIVGRIVEYESNPYMDETDWYRQGAVMANDARSGYSTYFLQQWARRLMLESGYMAVDTFFFMRDNPVIGREFILNNVNSGIALFFYRGWASFNNDWAVGNARLLRNGRKMPFWLMPTCNSGDFADHNLATHGYTEDFLWAPNGGCIGAVGASGSTHTTYNNVFAGGVLNSFYRDGIWTTGWAVNRGKIEMYRHFGLFNDAYDPQVQNLRIWEAHSFQLNLIGDAGSELWTGIPQPMRVVHNQRLNRGENRFMVSIRSVDDAPIADVNVTLVQNGSLRWAGQTDADGQIIFLFTSGELDTSSLQLTVWQHNKIPYLADIRVERPSVDFTASSFIIDDDNAGRSRGNGDRSVNPGETIEFRTYIVNSGDSTLRGSLDVSLTSVEGDIRLMNGQYHLNSAPAPGDSSLATFLFEVLGTNWNKRRLLFDIEVINEVNRWNSALQTEIVSFDLEYARHSFTPADFEPGDTVWLDITLRNNGRISSPVMHGALTSHNPMVLVYQNRAQFNPISVDCQDSLATARYRIFAHRLTVPGNCVEMLLRLESENGRVDTARFDFAVSQPRVNAPFGPDAYGYVCFDNTDTLWDTAPEYAWIEIDTNLGGRGINTGLRDLGNEQDVSTLVNLPFNFRYYGRDFNQLTICSNGWAALGNEARSADFTNRRIPPAYGPRAMICVFWDNLVNYIDRINRMPIGGVYTYFDEPNHRFIVEWSRMRRYVGRLGGDTLRPGGENTFELILYDPQHYPTYTGDGEFVMQYNTVNNDAAVDPTEYDTPYATVGIVNLDGSDGMEYTFWNRYAPSAAPLQAGRAIKFSTKIVGIVGFVRGTVTDLATVRPIPGAQVRGSRGSFAITDLAGNYLMHNVLVGEGYSFTASAPGYCDSTRAEYDITLGDTIEVSFALLHPEFTLSERNIGAELQPNCAAEQVISIQNNGNGRLDFRSYIDYAGEPSNWQRLMNFNVTAATQDWRINGVDFFDDAIWVTGSSNNDNPNQFYRFDTQGRFLGSLSQPGNTVYGIRGTTVVDTLLYGGEGGWIIGVNRLGQVKDSIPSPMQLPRALTYDTNEDRFWTANGLAEPLVQFDRDGNVTASHQILLDIYGLAFYAQDPDGYTVYIFSRDRIDPRLQVPTALVSKFNPRTADYRAVTGVEGDVADRAGGMEFSNKFDPRKWVMLAVMNNANGHRVSVYDVGPNTNWVSYIPRSAAVDPGCSQPITVRFNAFNLSDGEYSLVIRFLHNAAGSQTLLPVTLRVDSAAIIDKMIKQPLIFGIESNFPNPFNSQTRLVFNLEADGWTKLALFDLTGRETFIVREGWFEAGKYEVNFGADRLANGVYILRLETLGKVDVRKVVFVK